MISNARIIRWSDGSLTLQTGANPKSQFELSATPVAPPQNNPPKPTPTSTIGRVSSQTNKSHGASVDKHTYVYSGHEASEILRGTNKVTTALKVVDLKARDVALDKLQTSMANAIRGTTTNRLNIISVTEDPELAKRKAEMAEREQVKAAKKLAQNMAREAERTNRQLSKHGLGRSGGLNTNDLEGEGLGRVGGTRRGAGATPGKKRAARKGADSDTDEDDMPRGRTKEDEYDKTDDFLADSDEEEEEDAGGDDDEELEDADAEADDDDDMDMGMSASKSKTPHKETSPTPATPNDKSGGARSRRRRVVNDEDDDDE